MCRLKLSYFFLIFLCVVTPACSQRDTTASLIPESSTSYSANVKADDFAPGQLEAHYLKHGYQFGNITQAQYLDNARELLNAPAGNDVLEKTRTSGDILHYRVSTGEFAVMTRNGRMKTYFKTDYQYWMRQ
jgi:pyocin large subunit-like protein